MRCVTGLQEEMSSKENYLATASSNDWMLSLFMPVSPSESEDEGTRIGIRTRSKTRSKTKVYKTGLGSGVYLVLDHLKWTSTTLYGKAMHSKGKTV